MSEDIIYTHEVYRKAGIAHLQNEKNENEFYYRRKLITQDTANQIVREYLKHKAKHKKKEKKGSE